MANINKYKSYKNIADNYNHALSLISGRSLALGEPAVVLYYTPDVTSPDKKINMLFAIGSLNGKFSVFDPKKDNTIDPNHAFDPQSQTVHVTPQTLTEEQKKQARENIGFGNGDIDSNPTAGSDNLVTSGGIYKSIEEISGSINSQVGYYICSTPGEAPEKTIDASGYVLIVGGDLRVKFVEKNTAEDATLNIEGTGDKPLYYNGSRVSVDNSWHPGEVVTLFYDGASFQCNSLPDTDEYDVSAHNSHEITETKVTTRTAVYGGNSVNTWESNTPYADSSALTIIRKETSTGETQNTSNVEGPTVKYHEDKKKTSVTWVTTEEFTGVVNNYTFDEAVALVPESYRHGGLKLKFIKNSVGTSDSDNDKYVEYRYTGTYSAGNKEEFLDISNWENLNDSFNRLYLCNDYEINKYRGKDGIIYDRENYFVTEPIYLPAGSKVTFDGVTDEDVCVLCEVNYFNDFRYGDNGDEIILSKSDGKITYTTNSNYTVVSICSKYKDKSSLPIVELPISIFAYCSKIYREYENAVDQLNEEIGYIDNYRIPRLQTNKVDSSYGGSNLLDENQFDWDGIWQNNEFLSINDNYGYSDYIPCKYPQKIIVSNVLADGEHTSFSVYSEEFDYRRDVVLQPGQNVFESEEYDGYVKINLYGGKSLKYHANYGDTLNEYKPYNPIYGYLQQDVYPRLDSIDDIISDIPSNLNEKINSLYVCNDYTLNSYRSENGTISSTRDKFFVTKPIFLPKGSVITIDVTDYETSGSHHDRFISLCEVNWENNYISTLISRVSEDQKTYTAERDMFVSNCSVYSDESSLPTVELSISLSAYDSYIVRDVYSSDTKISELDSRKADSSFGDTNVLDRDKIVWGTIVRDGEEIHMDENYGCSDYILCEYPQKLSVFGVLDDYAYPSFTVYDKSKRYLRSVNNTNTFVSIPGDCYVRVNLHGGSSLQPHANYGDRLKEYKAYNPIYGYLEQDVFPKLEGITLGGYTKEESDARFALIGSSYTKDESDGKYALKGDAYTKDDVDSKFNNVYTKAESDRKYVLDGSTYTKDEVDNKFNNVYTKSDSDGKYALKGDAYTKAESDGKYATIGSSYTKDEVDSKLNDVYTKSESDDKYASKSDVYTKKESDGKYVLDGSTYTKDEVDSKFNNVYTKEESDGKYISGDNVYTKGECDDKFALKGDSYTKDESDGKYISGDNVYTKGEIDGKVDSIEAESNTMKEQINRIVVSQTTMSFSASPSVIYAEESGQTISLSSRVTTIGTVTKHTIKRGETVISDGSGNQLSGTDNDTNTQSDIIYTAVSVINGVNITRTTTVYAKYPIYYGAADDWSAINVDANKAPAKMSPGGTYNIKIAKDGQSVFFNVPSGMTIRKATVSGFDMPFKAPVKRDVNGKEYNSYESANTYTAGTLTVVVVS